MDPHHIQAAEALLTYIRRSPTPFHAVANAVVELRTAGFLELSEVDPWKIKPGGRYYVTRNGSSLAAFVAGTAPAAETGLRIVGAHTDSPNLRLKPLPEIRNQGYLQLGVEVYGGVLLASWTDRDLGLAGRVVVREEGGGTDSQLLLIDRPIGRIPQVAIHLDREVNTKGLILNRETQLPPIVGLESSSDVGFDTWLGEQVGVDAQDVLAHELMFFDLQAPTVSGLNGEFIHAARIDNLACCHAALHALIAGSGYPGIASRIAMLYDNEEIGSNTAQGAAGSFLQDIVSRLVSALGEDAEGYERTRTRSFLISADMAHAVHPNYPDKHEARHLPQLNKGPVIKINANARYATDAESSARFQQLCDSIGVPYQKFVMRADMPCGSTIGPIVSTRLGVKTVDVGNPMLSMHSCREMAGTADHLSMIQVMARFFED